MKIRSVALMLAFAAGCSPFPESEQPERRGQMANRSPEMVERATSRFHTLRDAVLGWYLEAHPVRATELGIHAYDGQLPDLSRAAHQRRIDTYLDWRADLEDISLTHLEGADRYDYGILQFALQRELLDLEETRTWARDPRLYTDVIARGIMSLMTRGLDPDGVRALTSRMAAGPDLLTAARQNLSGAPRLWTERAAAETGALIRFLERGLPEAVGAAGADMASVASERDALVAALGEHQAWLESDLLPRATGEYRLGRYLFERKLLYEEHLALSIPELTRLNQASIDEFQAEIERVAAEIDPDRSVGAIVDSLAALHPDGDELLTVASEMVRSVHDWTRRSDVVTVPDDATAPEVRASPVHARERLAFADGPGPFGPADGPRVLYVAVDPPRWSSVEGQEYLSYFSRPNLLGLVLYHTFPGRLLQQAHLREVESRVRGMFLPRSFTDGWGHYAEEMAIEAGYAEGDPVTRLGQLRRALQYHARWYASMSLHALDRPFDDVMRRFMQIAYVPESLARRELERASYDPMYFAAALGRVQIGELRKDYQASREEKGELYTPAAFHDRLLGLGLPVAMAREALIPLETPGSQQQSRRR